MSRLTGVDRRIGWSIAASGQDTTRITSIPRRYALNLGFPTYAKLGLGNLQRNLLTAICHPLGTLLPETELVMKQS